MKLPSIISIIPLLRYICAILRSFDFIDFVLPQQPHRISSPTRAHCTDDVCLLCQSQSLDLGQVMQELLCVCAFRLTLWKFYGSKH